ncbi:hypothetical protein jhhlp_008069 [Lomentospora prolificans]|uniref:Pathway-specific nitrogen regulator n=1 Tax=Lomentospora prolificans TaxID=41688 RepID=A0A2N3MZG3_9PEZI|nr:hypothetical protein jhhlp_008069 [Lomentospora prolificans]
MTRVTQDFDFTIHEDEPSINSAADKETESPPEEVKTRESLGAEEVVEEDPEEASPGPITQLAEETADEAAEDLSTATTTDTIGEAAPETLEELAYEFTEDPTDAPQAESAEEPEGLVEESNEQHVDESENLPSEMHEESEEQATEGNDAAAPADQAKEPQDTREAIAEEASEGAAPAASEVGSEAEGEHNASADHEEEIEQHHEEHDILDDSQNHALDQDTEDLSMEHDDDREARPEDGEIHNESEVHHDDRDAEEDDAQEGDDEDSQDAQSRRISALSSNGYRRTSGRTDALIQAAARAVVARIEKRGSSSDAHSIDGDAEFSILSHTTDAHEDEDEVSGLGDHTELSYAERSEASLRASDAGSATAPATDDPGNDSSSHNEADDDVFSDRSPRSSMGSISSDPDRKYSLDETISQATHSPRISNISQYDKDDFIPTARNTPRPPFRTPSSVRAMQMSSPPTSVYGSPRSSKRHYPTISRLGSPTVSAQYSPKGRSTPSRLKERKEAPLVLLHVTLLPLRWPWADVLEVAEVEELSQPAKSLRDSWRQLQDRMGDTVLERGVLLPHPQDDYELLEERVLEALELPLKRKARILECGHYLGPSNIMTIESDTESEDEDWEKDGRLSRIDEEDKSHWCNTCKHEIKYESLGPGKVFRVKVYASNGLMKAGAWGACWKEMERVDIEIEPIVDASLQGELNELATEQERREEEARIAEEMEEAEEDMEHDGHFDSSVMADQGQAHILSSPPVADMRLEQQSRSLMSRPQSRILNQSPNPDMRMQEHHTSVVNRQQRFMTESPSQDMDMVGGRQSMASPRNSRMLSSPPPPSNLRIEDRAHSTELNHRQSHIMSSPRTSDMRIEDRTHSPALTHSQSRVYSSPAMRESHMDSHHIDTERRRRDEERLREIYGHTPPHHHEDIPSPSGHHHEDSYMPGPSPPSPSQEAFERREERRETRRKAYQSASLPELLLEAAKVVLQDRRNLVIGLLGVIALMLALRGSSGSADRYSVHNHFPMAGIREVPSVQPAEPIVHNPVVEEVKEIPTIEKAIPAKIEAPRPDIEEELEILTETVLATEVVTELVTETEVVNKEVRRVVETVTEVETVKVTATTTTTEMVHETVQVPVQVPVEEPVAPNPCDDMSSEAKAPAVNEVVFDAEPEIVEKVPAKDDAVEVDSTQHDEL